MVGPDEDAHDGESVRLPTWRFWVSTAGAGPGSARCWTAGTSRCSPCPTSPPSWPFRTSSWSAIDMPIGLSDDGAGRATSWPASGSGRAGSSVFPAPVRRVLGCADYAAACEVSRRGIGQGALGAGVEPGPGHPRVRRRTGRAGPTARVRGAPRTGLPRARRPRRRPQGERPRAGPADPRARAGDGRAGRPGRRPPGVPAVDALDACAAAWSARRLADGRRRVRRRRRASTAAAGRCGSAGERRVAGGGRRDPRPPPRGAGPQLRAGPGRRCLPRRRHALAPGRGGRPDRRRPRGDPASVDGGEHPRPLRPLLRQCGVPAGGDLGVARLRRRADGDGGRAAGRRRRRVAGCGRPRRRRSSCGRRRWTRPTARRRRRRPRRRRPGGGAALPRPRTHRPRPGGGGGGRRGRDGDLRRRPRGAGRPAGVRGRLARGVAGDPRPAARPRPRTRRPRSRCGRRRGVRRHPAEELLAVLSALREDRLDAGPYPPATMRTPRAARLRSR